MSFDILSFFLCERLFSPACSFGFAVHFDFDSGFVSVLDDSVDYWYNAFLYLDSDFDFSCVMLLFSAQEPFRKMGYLVRKNTRSYCSDG